MDARQNESITERAMNEQRKSPCTTMRSSAPPLRSVRTRDDPERDNCNPEFSDDTKSDSPSGIQLKRPKATKKAGEGNRNSKLMS